MDDSFRLLTFNPYDDVRQNNDDENDSNVKKTKEFIIQMFGINEKGKTASIFVEGYNPFFYAKVGDDWTEVKKCEFVEKLNNDLGDYYADAIVSTKLIKRKKLYGFDAGKQHTFILIKFINEAAMKKAKNLWYTSSTNKKTGEYTKQLKPNGYMFGATGTILYEAQIPPLLRLFHIKEISPSGWITLPRSKTLKHKRHRTTCDYEYTINYKNIIPLPKKETSVPYKICSFDIEASSSHGDFPLAVKNYKKLATNIVDLCNETNCTEEFIKRIIMTAFGGSAPRPPQDKIGSSASCSPQDKIGSSGPRPPQYNHIDSHPFSPSGGLGGAPPQYNHIDSHPFSPSGAPPQYNHIDSHPFSPCGGLGGAPPKDKIGSSASCGGLGGAPPMDDVDLVYPIHSVTLDVLHTLFARWIKQCPATYKKENEMDCDIDDNYNDERLDDDEDTMDVPDVEEGLKEADAEETIGFSWKTFKAKIKSYKKKGSIIDLLLDKDEVRETKILELTRTLTSTFPKLKGDNVTFIGSTFVRYGESKPYLNHCIARDTCDALPQIENSVIESYKTEKEVLLAWTKLIQKENPDIIIGYNIFGFDYQFMFLRAKELGCEHKFLELSRNKNEVCINKDWRTKKEGLEESKNVLAGGQYDLKFIKMTGRLQIDLLNYFRREYQLNHYNLNYVAGYFIGDGLTKLEHTSDGNTKIYSKNLTGLENGSFISFEEEAHSIDYYKEGKKFEVYDVDLIGKTFMIKGIETPDMKKKVRWGLAKDDLTPQDIFRMTNEGSKDRSVVAKYCLQDCNLVHHLMRKIDVMTGFIEMSNLCSVPLEFLVMRGQGIKLTSYIAKKCREKGTLMPVNDKAVDDEGYEGAIVLEPKCDLYLDDPVACLDFSSLYPSGMMSDNISHDSKVLTKEYNLKGELINETGEKDPLTGFYIYDNLPGYTYVDITYDTYKWQRKNDNPKAGMEKIKVGYKTCRWAQFPNGAKAIMPSILEELLAARKATRKLAENHPDEFMKNILDKRQLSIKVTNNSMYGQTGAKTSSFYDKDCAASTTAIGRKLLTYAKRVVEEAYADQILETKNYGKVQTNAEYVYGDTDSVFFKFNLRDMDGKKIIGQKALEITIELAQQVGELASMFLKAPHDLEYEKTFLPFCLLSKKRYVGILYELDATKGKRKSMGIVLKRRDNAPIVKDIYGGVIDIFMKDKDVEKAIAFLRICLQNITDEKYGMDKLIITKSLRSGYKNPKQIAHKVLADRIGRRDPGNKPSIGDRIPFIYIENPDKKALQGERIETPEFIIANKGKVKINYSFYITNQIMKPLQQLFALVLEKMKDFKKKKGHSLHKWYSELEQLKKEYPDAEQHRKKLEAIRNKEVKYLLFDDYLYKADNLKKGNQAITGFFRKM
jgi:DNA polymerase elongation subunit (family B)